MMLHYSRTRKQIPWEIKELIKQNDFFELSQAVHDYYFYWSEKNIERRKKEYEYNAYAHRLFSFLKKGRFDNLRMVSNAASIPHNHCIRIVRKWHSLGIADVQQVQRNGDKTTRYSVMPLVKVLPSLLYTYDRDQQDDLKALSQTIQRKEPERKPRLPKYGMSKNIRAKIIREQRYAG